MRVAKKPLTSIASNWDKDEEDFEQLPKNWSTIGSGWASQAHVNQKRPNEVIKHTYLLHQGEQTCTYQFLRICLNHQDNPYFPKVKKATGYPGQLDNSGVTRLITIMERLERMNNKDIQHLGILCGVDKPEEKQQYIRTMFADASIRREIIRNTPDPQFAQAIRLLSPLFAQFGSDMHFSNIMVRTGPQRQLVIIDP